jgi:hypothetical protein
LKDPITNVNETIKTPQDLNTNKEKFKEYDALVPISFELDPNTTLIHVLGKDELDHVSNNCP